jgi:hypothetical protein
MLYNGCQTVGYVGCYYYGKLTLNQRWFTNVGPMLVFQHWHNIGFPTLGCQHTLDFPTLPQGFLSRYQDVFPKYMGQKGGFRNLFIFCLNEGIPLFNTPIKYDRSHPNHTSVWTQFIKMWNVPPRLCFFI